MHPSEPADNAGAGAAGARGAGTAAVRARVHREGREAAEAAEGEPEPGAAGEGGAEVCPAPSMPPDCVRVVRALAPPLLEPDAQKHSWQPMAKIE